MAAQRATVERTRKDTYGSLDATDSGLLRGLSLDGRRSASDLARELGISRAYASRKLQALLKRKGIRVRAFSSPTALGYRAGAMTAIRVSPGGMAGAVEVLRSFPSVCLLMITSGREDIVIFTLFPAAADLSTFLREDLAGVPGVQSTETLIMSDWRVRDVVSEPGAGFYSYVSTPSAGRNGLEGPKTLRSGPVMRDPGPSTGLDLRDLKILREIERDPRQQVSVLAKKVGVSQRSASARLHSLLKGGVTRVVVYTSPFAVGLSFFPVTGVRVAPGEVEAVSARLEALPSVFWVNRVSGRYDLIVGTMFAGPVAVSDFVWQELARIPGVLSMETSIGLEIRKWSLPYLAGALLDSLARPGSQPVRPGPPYLSS